LSRSYKNVFPKKFMVYSVEELMNLYSVNANTVSNWVGEGLTPSDKQRPYLFQGAEVQRFHKIRKARKAKSLRPGEFTCFTCKASVFPDIGTVSDTWSIHEKHMYAALCPDCGAQVRKISNEADQRIIEDCRNPNINRHRLREEDGSVPAGIGITGTFGLEGLHTVNDRVIHEWLTYAGQYDVKTVDRHLSAIRYFENLLAGKPFNKLIRDDVAKVRDDLKRRAEPDAADTLSSSSIKHVVSYLSAFFDWLLKQDGFKGLPKDLQGYLKLPKAVLASAAPVQKKDYPSLDEAKLLLSNMLSWSLVDQRARVIFALAFLGALRADTLTSLRIKHIDTDCRLILQDGGRVRAKAGKSIHILWFPIPKCFETAVTEWLHALKGLGFTGEDALFPASDWLKHRPVTQGATPKPVPVMTTTHAVTEAFAIACRDQAVKFTPHSAKHSIAAERDVRPLTHLERKAWSENMGHENEQTTERHYGKLPDDKRFEVLEHIGANARIDPLAFSDDEKIAFFDGILDLMRNR
jgi:integrase